MPDLSFSSLLPGFITALLAACLVLLIILLVRQRRALEAQRESGLSQQDSLEALSEALLEDLSAQILFSVDDSYVQTETRIVISPVI